MDSSPICNTSFRKIFGDNSLYVSVLKDLLQSAKALSFKIYTEYRHSFTSSPHFNFDQIHIDLQESVSGLLSYLYVLEKTAFDPRFIHRLMKSQGSSLFFFNNEEYLNEIIKASNRACKPLSHFSDTILFRNSVDNSGSKPRVITKLNNRFSEETKAFIKTKTFVNCKNSFELIYDHYFLNSQISSYSKSLSKHVIGYRKNVNQLDHARAHIRSQTLITLDIKSFFDSITLKNMIVKNQFLQVLIAGFELQTGLLFEKASFKHDWMYDYLLNFYKVVNSLMITAMQFFTYNGTIPTGANYSPAFSNLIIAPIDHWIVNTYLTSKTDVVYTRFADDMALSTTSGMINGKFNLSMADCVSIEKQLKNYGFMLNYNKTAIMPPGKRKSVAGVVIDQSNLDKPVLSLGHGRKMELLNLLSTKNFDDLDLTDKGTLAWVKSVNRDCFESIVSAIGTKVDT